MELSSNFFARLGPAYCRWYLTFLNNLASLKLFLTDFFFYHSVPFLTPKDSIQNSFLASLLQCDLYYLVNHLFIILLCLKYQVLSFAPHISSGVLKAASFFIKELSKTISS